jgi:hypothetical protein
MGRRRRDGKHTPQKKKKIEYRIQWEMKQMDTKVLTQQNNDKCY